MAVQEVAVPGDGGLRLSIHRADPWWNKRGAFDVFSEPMHGPQQLKVVDIKARQVTLRWEPFGYNVTRCHNYSLTVEYRARGGKDETPEEVSYDGKSSAPQYTIHNLTPFTNLSVKLVLRNREGVKESVQIHIQTEEDGERTFFIMREALCSQPSNLRHGTSTYTTTVVSMAPDTCDFSRGLIRNI